jgi:ferredoxin
VPETRPEESEAMTAESPEVLSGFEALARVARAICGRAVSRSPAEAEGLALAGLRAASLSEGVATARGAGIALPSASCVHHVRGAPGREPFGAFEFTSASAQEAIDHSLAAHRLSGDIGRPGLCSLDPWLGDRLNLVRVPGADVIADALGTPAPEAEDDGLLERAREALRSVAQRTGRPLDVVDRSGEDGAELVLIGSGAGAARAREAARALCAAGVPAAAVSVNLVRPFPDRAVGDALVGARTVIVAEAPDAADGLLARVQVLLDGRSQVQRAVPSRLLATVAAHVTEGALGPDRLAPRQRLPGHRLVVLPAGPWGEETARRLVALLGELGPLRLGRRVRRRRGASVLAWESDAWTQHATDLLVAADPAHVEPHALRLLRPRGAVVVMSPAASSDDLVQLLPADTRTLLRECELALLWVPPPEVAGSEVAGAADVALGSALAGGALVALASPGDSPDAAAAEQVAGCLERTGAAESARWLLEGAQRARWVERAALDPSRRVEEVDFRAAPKLPRLPEPVDDPAELERWAGLIRRFHRTGQPSFGPGSRAATRPAALQILAEARDGSRHHPFVLIPSEGPDAGIAARGLRDLLVEAVAAVQATGREARALVDNTERLVFLASRQLARGAAAADLGELLDRAGRRLGEELALPAADARALSEDLAELCRRAPGNGLVFDLRSDMPVQLTLTVLEAVREPLRQRFSRELEQLREQLCDLLQLDRMRSREGRTAEALAATLGSAAADRLDPEALARTLTAGPGSEPLEPERRRRIERTLAILESHLKQVDALPPVLLLRPPGVRLTVPQCRQQEHANPMAAAIGLFDGLAQRMVAVMGAARVARLEVGGNYRPELHDEPLAALDWEALSADELNLLPAVVVVSTGRRLREGEQAALSELLRSSRPVHAIVLDEVAAADEAQDLSRFHVDLGYLVMAHREALAVGSSLARPERLTEGLVRAARALRPAVILVHFPGLQSIAERPLLAEAALCGRAAPEFRYDPDAGSSWADRFDLSENPQPERAWPLHGLAYLEDGVEKSMEVAVTFADAVAHEPAYAGHLQIIPRVAWDDEQIPLAEYLERMDAEAREPWIPFLWSIDDRGILQRAVVTRALAMACADRRRSWRVLQELAGYENVFAQRAAADAQAEAEVKRSELVQAHGEDLDQARREGAHESMQRLAEVLMSSDGLAATASAAPPSVVAPPAEVAVAAEPAPVTPVAPVEGAPEEEEALSFEEPYIDTLLCTSCNECTDLNGQLFRYNADKQAFIGDPRAGTFAELVKAAELCPARCIHPGKPRSDDSTATPELIERAAAFN